MGPPLPAKSVKAKTGHTHRAHRAIHSWGFGVTHQHIDVWGNCSSVTAKVQSSPLPRPGSPFCGSVIVEATWAAHLDTAQSFLCGGDGDFGSWIPLGQAADNLGCLQRAEARGGYSGCSMGAGVLVSVAKESLAFIQISKCVGRTEGGAC